MGTNKNPKAWRPGDRIFRDGQIVQPPTAPGEPYLEVIPPRVRGEPELIRCPWCGMGFVRPLHRADGGIYCPICLGQLQTPLTAKKHKKKSRSSDAPPLPRKEQRDRQLKNASELFPWLSKKTARALLAIAERDQWICQLCLRPVVWQPGHTPRNQRPTLDHRRPRAKGGRSVRENLQLAHSLCNARKGDTWDEGDVVVG